MKLITSYNKARVFVPGKPFQPSLMFVGEARSHTKARAKHELLFNKLASGHQT